MFPSKYRKRVPRRTAMRINKTINGIQDETSNRKRIPRLFPLNKFPSKSTGGNHHHKQADKNASSTMGAREISSALYSSSKLVKITTI